MWIVRGARGGPGWGDRVRRLREARGWSQDDLAERAGTTQAQVSRIEAGRHPNARTDTLWGLADALGVSLDMLVGRDAASASVDEDARLGRIVRAALAGQDGDQQAAGRGHKGQATRKRDSRNLKAHRDPFGGLDPAAAMVS